MASRFDKQRTPFAGSFSSNFRPIKTQEPRVGSCNVTIYSNTRTLRSCDIRLWAFSAIRWGQSLLDKAPEFSEGASAL